MAFMVPQYTREAFHRGENRHGETITMPADVYGSLARFMTECKIAHGTGELIEGKWWGRLSAPGYMDATEWSGPYDTRDDARDAIADMYDVDPDTGDEPNYGEP